VTLHLLWGEAVIFVVLWGRRGWFSFPLFLFYFSFLIFNEAPPQAPALPTGSEYLKKKKKGKGEKKGKRGEKEEEKGKRKERKKIRVFIHIGAKAFVTTKCSDLRQELMLRGGKKKEREERREGKKRRRKKEGRRKEKITERSGAQVWRSVSIHPIMGPGSNSGILWCYQCTNRF
jgi:hypothetical protein